MFIVYADKRLERCFSDYRELKKRLPLPWIKTIMKDLKWLEVSASFGDFLDLGVCQPEALKGELQGYWSLHVSANARLILLPEGSEDILCCNTVRIEGVVDYHGKSRSWYLP